MDLRCTKPGFYPWPSQDDPNRTIEVFDNDVFTLNRDGTYTMHTGICKIGIVIPAELMEPWPDQPVRLVMENL